MSNNEARKQNIIPPYLLEYIAKTCDANDKECVLNTLEHVNKLMKNSINKNALNSQDDPLIYKKKPEPEDSYSLPEK
ncbi:protealysin propeptide domain-containing protein [Xenorhabdus eapokensis]|uniref:Peptidase M4 n=1 Tax=Xenorhabdus eapokensis TaxID=1873482 RepID=A0A1Q5TUV5_9GAMM|nr:protealysin propeptide domain-containing protein [Xenorhabdus eapokensis]OKP03960.1 peptidase M4 [Xenorhabdus eapokensis]